MKYIVLLLYSFVGFAKNTWGITIKPYSTYRTIVSNPKAFELIYIAGVCLGYFALASLIRIPAFHLNLLTKQFFLLNVGAMFGYVLSVVAIKVVGKFVGGKGNIQSILVGWGYTLIPTVLWFLLTSVLFISFPPPRTETIKGVSFSILYLLISFVLLFWKIELFYLTLRFGMRLDLKKIIIVSVLLIPFIILYTLLMYHLNIFRIPFI